MDSKTQSPREVVCNWFTVEKTRAYLQERQPDGDVPEDVHSEEFAEWLTHQMRLAMARGIMIGEQRREEIGKLTDTEQSAEYAAYLSSLNRGAFETCWTNRSQAGNTTDTEGGA